MMNWGSGPSHERREGAFQHVAISANSEHTLNRHAPDHLIAYEALLFAVQQ